MFWGGQSLRPEVADKSCWVTAEQWFSVAVGVFVMSRAVLRVFRVRDCTCGCKADARASAGVTTAEGPVSPCHGFCHCCFCANVTATWNCHKVPSSRRLVAIHNDVLNQKALTGLARLLELEIASRQALGRYAVTPKD